MTSSKNLHIKLKSFSNIAQPLHKEAVHGCSFLYINAKKSVIMSEAFLVDVSIFVIRLVDSSKQKSLIYPFENINYALLMAEAQYL